MNGSVSTLSIIFMAVSCLIAFALPVGLLIWLHVKKGADILPFFIGCAVMLIFALVLESAVHRVVFASSVGKGIRDSLWLSALYGGLMAGLFEETGRYLAFRTVLKKHQNNDANALMYGAGHGGFEAIALLGTTMINNILFSVMINSGNTAALTGSLSGDALAQVEASISALIESPPYLFLLGGVERVFAVLLQISLSVLVWFAAKKEGRRGLFPAAVLIHFAVDAISVILSGFGLSNILVEAAIGIMSVLAALYARQMWRGSVSP